MSEAAVNECRGKPGRLQSAARGRTSYHEASSHCLALILWYLMDSQSSSLHSPAVNTHIHTHSCDWSSERCQKQLSATAFAWHALNLPVCFTPLTWCEADWKALLTPLNVLQANEMATYRVNTDIIFLTTGCDNADEWSHSYYGAHPLVVGYSASL